MLLVTSINSTANCDSLGFYGLFFNYSRISALSFPCCIATLGRFPSIEQPTNPSLRPDPNVDTKLCKTLSSTRQPSNRDSTNEWIQLFIDYHLAYRNTLLFPVTYLYTVQSTYNPLFFETSRSYGSTTSFSSLTLGLFYVLTFSFDFCKKAVGEIYDTKKIRPCGYIHIHSLKSSFIVLCISMKLGELPKFDVFDPIDTSEFHDLFWICPFSLK
ncbi:hypothetical protein BDC45DRAFT_538739 [Circinella umbellata]|nr:hypothetical protein BDC45DRAFT_538739 [Circinella umbellata]